MGYDVTLSRPEPPALFDLHLSPAARRAVEVELGNTLPDLPVAIDTARAVIYQLGPTEWLLRTARERESEVHGQLEQCVRQQHALITLMTDAYAAFRVDGPDAASVLAQGIAIDLHEQRFPSGSATRCGFAKTSAVVHCVRAGERYDLLVDIAYERYAARWLRAAAGEPVAL